MPGTVLSSSHVFNQLIFLIILRATKYWAGKKKKPSDLFLVCFLIQVEFIFIHVHADQFRQKHRHLENNSFPYLQGNLHLEIYSTTTKENLHKCRNEAKMSLYGQMHCAAFCKNNKVWCAMCGYRDNWILTMTLNLPTYIYIPRGKIMTPGMDPFFPLL